MAVCVPRAIVSRTTRVTWGIVCDEVVATHRIEAQITVTTTIPITGIQHSEVVEMRVFKAVTRHRLISDKHKSSIECRKEFSPPVQYNFMPCKISGIEGVCIPSYHLLKTPKLTMVDECGILNGLYAKEYRKRVIRENSATQYQRHLNVHRLYNYARLIIT